MKSSLSIFEEWILGTLVFGNLKKYYTHRFSRVMSNIEKRIAHLKSDIEELRITAEKSLVAHSTGLKDRKFPKKKSR